VRISCPPETPSGSGARLNPQPISLNLPQKHPRQIIGQQSSIICRQKVVLWLPVSKIHHALF
jgi:hypothetical protein